MSDKRFLTLYIAAAAMLQCVTGNVINEWLLSFPLNVILFCVWTLLVLVLYYRERSLFFVRYMQSRRAVITSIVMVAVVALVMGFVPQLPQYMEAEISSGVAKRLGLYDFDGSWLYAAVMLYVMTCLFVVTLAGVSSRFGKSGKVVEEIRFFLLHGGLLIAICASFWGAGDCDTVQIKVSRDEVSQYGINEKGAVVYTGHDMLLTDFIVDYHDSTNVPSHYAAMLSVDSVEVKLTVNHPCRLDFGRELYLRSYDISAGCATRFCMVDMVSDPWSGVKLVGIILMIAGAVMLFIVGPIYRKCL